MITVFTKNIPIQLASQMQEQYNTLVIILKSYADSDNDRYYLKVRNNYDLSCFILALSIFYKSVVIPLHEGGQCLKDFKNKGAGDIKEIKIGKYLFSSSDSRWIQNMYSDLHETLEKYRIPEYLLLFSDIREFARNLNVYLNNNYD